MTKHELQESIDSVRNRHNNRVVGVMALMLGILFVGFLFAPDPSTQSPEHRKLYIYGVMCVFVLVGIIGGGIILQVAKRDCTKFGVLCPKCGLNLYSRRRLIFGGRGTRETGIC